MTKYLFIFVLLSSLCLAAPQNEIQNLMSAKDANHFFSSYGPTLLVHGVQPWKDVLGDLSEASELRIRKIPVSYISKLGVKEGDIIQSVNIETSKKNDDYVVKKEIFILLFHDSEVTLGRYWNRFNLILSDDPKVHQVLQNYSIERYVDGVAYVGTDRKIQSAPSQQVEMELVSKNDKIYNSVHFGGKKQIHKVIKSTRTLNSNLYIQIDPQQNGVYSGILETDSGKQFSIPSSISLLKDQKIVTFYNWLMGYKLLHLTEFNKTDRCDVLVLISSKDYSKIELPCDDRD